MNLQKCLEQCGQRQNPNLALKIIKRYKLEFSQANKSYTTGAIRREFDEWSLIVDSLLALRKK